MISSGLRSILALLVSMNVAAPGGNAEAQSYPDRPVTVVVAVAAGGLTDVLTRAVTQRLSEKWGQPVIVENRPGGAYQAGARSVLSAPSDGYTLFTAGNGLITITPHLYKKKKLTYEVDDFVPVADLGGIPQALLTSPTFPAKSINELIALAKERPRTITYGASGPGTSPHMAMLLLESLTGIQLTAVHYRGIGPAVIDLMSGQINLLAIGPTIALSSYRAGKLGMIGVGSLKSAPGLDGIPPIADSVPGFEVLSSFGLFARAGTPEDVISKINKDVREVLGNSEFKKQFLEPNLIQARLWSPSEFSESLQTESNAWKKVVENTGLNLD
jgi:tripartite-type tricarboxylate transporter receptor subunit TctC